jgi:hypothetical protein
MDLVLHMRERVRVQSQAWDSSYRLRLATVLGCAIAGAILLARVVNAPPQPPPPLDAFVAGNVLAGIAFWITTRTPYQSLRSPVMSVSGSYGVEPRRLPILYIVSAALEYLLVFRFSAGGAFLSAAGAALAVQAVVLCVSALNFHRYSSPRGLL